ncbi:MAG: hypothetical protein WAT70_06420 [Rhizobiaceae bacterium]
MATIGLLPLARSTFDVAYAEEKLAGLKALLDSAGHRVVGGGLLFDAAATEDALAALAHERLDLLLIAQVTFTDASMAARIAASASVPVGIWAFPEPRTGGRLRLNSFCGLNLAAHAIGLAGSAFSWAYSDADAPGARALLADLLAGKRRASARRALPAVAGEEARRNARKAIGAIEGARIARIGERPAGFDTCAYDEATLKRLAGVSVTPLSLADLFAEAGAAAPDSVIAAREEAASTLSGLDAVDQVELDRSLRLRVALETLGKRGGYSAFAIRCWPEMFTEYGGAICGPVGMMGERRVPCACEADVHGALTNLLLQAMAGEAAFLVDIVHVDRDDDTTVVWHCGQAPASMRDRQVEARAGIHSNRKMPLLFEFPLKPGRVTFARISQAGGKLAVVVGGGEMLRRPLAYSGTAGVVRMDSGSAAFEDALVGSGLEHHLSLAYGDHRETVTALAAEMGLPVMAL